MEFNENERQTPTEILADVGEYIYPAVAERLGLPPDASPEKLAQALKAKIDADPSGQATWSEFCLAAHLASEDVWPVG